MVCRIVLAEDSLIVRTGIEGLLLVEDDVDIVQSTASFSELIDAVELHRPDLVITDVRMPPTHQDEGINAATLFRTTYPDMAVLVLSQAADPVFVRRLIEGGSGGRGYLLKDNLATAGQLVQAIELLRKGGSFIDPAMVDLLVKHQARKVASPLSLLTDRERETLAAVASGGSNNGIAEQMWISHRAVEKHINSIFAKLGLFDDPDINRRVQAVLMFLDG